MQYTSEVVIPVIRNDSGGRQQYFRRINTFSDVPIATPRLIRVRSTSLWERKRIHSALAQRQAWEKTEAGILRLSNVAQRFDVEPSEWYREHGFLDDVVKFRVPDIGTRNNTMKSRAEHRIPRDRADVRPMREGRQLSPFIVPLRRWEDLAPGERERTIRYVLTFGGTMSSMRHAYGAELDQAHMISLGTREGRPWSERFYSGPSDSRSKFNFVARRVGGLPGWPDGLDAKVVLAATLSETSRRRSFRIGKTVNGRDQFRYPAIDAAYGVITGVVAGKSKAEVLAPLSRTGGDRRGDGAAFEVATQMLRGVERPIELTQRSKSRFGESAPKTSAFVGAWLEPDGPDSFFVTDGHAVRGFMPHLDWRGSQDNPSEVRRYLYGDRSVFIHALHDYLAREVHADRGLSPSVCNARFLHRGQASQWGHEKLEYRPDDKDTKFEVCYHQLSSSAHLTPRIEHGWSAR